MTWTLDQAFLPFVDTKNHSVNDAGYSFYVGTTLGNNGKMTVIPQSGIKLTKTMSSTATAPTGAFVFDIINVSNASDNKTYSAWLIKADGSEQNVNVEFNNGSASVSLNADDTIYIGGMTHGEIFRIEERETIQYTMFERKKNIKEVYPC